MASRSAAERSARGFISTTCHTIVRKVISRAQAAWASSRAGRNAVRRRSLLEAIARVAMLAAGPPGGGPLWRRRLRRALSGLRLFRRLPEPAAREPLHHDVGVLPPQLIERRQQFFAL